MHIVFAQLIFEEIKHKDGMEKGSTDSICPREHFKDKPVDVSCSMTDKTQSGAGDGKKRKEKERMS